MTIGTALPVDWYRTSFAASIDALYFEPGGEEKVQLVLEMLRPNGQERILELACASGRRTLELLHRGFDVVGIDPRDELLEIASGEAELADLPGYFVDEDPRYLEFEQEFDLVLSLGGGAFEHFDSDEENQRAFAAAARALRPGGRLLMQTPNILHAEAHLPQRTWLDGGEAIDLIEQRWHAPTRRLGGVRRSLLEREDAEGIEAEPFQRRLYDVEELAQIFEPLGLRLANIFDEQGAPCTPTDIQQEVYVEFEL